MYCNKKCIGEETAYLEKIASSLRENAEFKISNWSTTNQY